MPTGENLEGGFRFCAHSNRYGIISLPKYINADSAGDVQNGESKIDKIRTEMWRPSMLIAS